MPKRKIIQIAIGNNDLVALCSDGSLWSHTSDSEFVGAQLVTRKWRRLDDPFQDEARVAKELIAWLPGERKDAP